MLLSNPGQAAEILISLSADFRHPPDITPFGLRLWPIFAKRDIALLLTIPV